MNAATEQGAPTQGRPTQRERLKAIIGGSTGNLVEWYDWYAYAAFTLYFAPHFFPSEDRTAQLLSAAGIFAVGFLMRPIGAWAMGVYADRHGRKSGLTLSVALMCAPLESRVCTAGRSPSRAANINGVRPSLSARLTSVSWIDLSCVDPGACCGTAVCPLDTRSG